MPVRSYVRIGRQLSSGTPGLRQRALVVGATFVLMLGLAPAATLGSGSPPLASDQADSTSVDTPLSIFLVASDPETDPLTFTIVSAPSRGTLDDCSAGSCTYTPNAAYVGSDSFTWTANDTTSDSNTATFSLTVIGLSSQKILSSGPLTRVEISPDLKCAVDYAGDSAPEFFGDTACATLVAVGGALFGPASIPAGGSASPLSPFTPVSQSAVLGAGTSGDPYSVVTVVDLGTTGLRLTQTDSYVTGQETYRTDVTISNTSGAAADAILYRAGDCYLQNSDAGFGASDAATGSVSCVSGVDDGTGTIVPGTRIEQWYPLSGGSSYYESDFNSVWTKIGTQTAFGNSCEQCANYIDNGAGLSWNVTIPAGGSVSRSHLTVFSPLGIVPLTTTKQAGQSTVTAGASNTYTVSVANPNTTSATLTAISDTLPAGFTYTAGSTSGATTSDPTISGQLLTWARTFTIPAGGTTSLTFGVSVSTTPGTYTNQAGGTAQSPFVVVGTGQTASVTVTGSAPAHLTLTKTVDNSAGGSGVATAWTLSASGPSSISGASGDSGITNASVSPGTYALAESGGPAGYNPGAWSCSGGTLTGSSLVLTAGATASCSITNTFVPVAPAHLTLTKTVDNSAGGSGVATAWTLSASGPSSISGASGDSGITNASVSPGTYALAESGGPAGYNPGAWSCSGGTLTGSSLVLAAGATASCSITNTFVPVIGGAGWSMTAAAAPDTVSAGDIVAFNITVYNETDAGGGTIALSAVTPAGATFLGATVSAGSCAPGAVLSCTTDNIALGSSRAAQAVYRTPGTGSSFSVEFRGDSADGPFTATASAALSTNPNFSSRFIFDARSKTVFTDQAINANNPQSTLVRAPTTGIVVSVGEVAGTTICPTARPCFSQESVIHVGAGTVYPRGFKVVIKLDRSEIPRRIDWWNIGVAHQFDNGSWEILPRCRGNWSHSRHRNIPCFSARPLRGRDIQLTVWLTVNGKLRGF